MNRLHACAKHSVAPEFLTTNCEAIAKCKKSDSSCFQRKKEIVWLLRQSGFTKEVAPEIIVFVEWILHFPKEYNEPFELYLEEKSRLVFPLLAFMGWVFELLPPHQAPSGSHSNHEQVPTSSQLFLGVRAQEEDMVARESTAAIACR